MRLLTWVVSLGLFVTSGPSMASKPTGNPECGVPFELEVSVAVPEFYRLYGDSTGEFVPSESFPVFDMVFELYVTSADLLLERIANEPSFHGDARGMDLHGDDSDVGREVPINVG